MRGLACSCVISIIAAGDAAADATNPNLLPFGERVSMLANAGITSARGEAVYYNPELSVSGSTFLRFELSSDALLVLQGEDQPFDASGFVAIPSTLVSTYKVAGWSLATAILVPDAFKLKNRVTFESADLRITQLLDQERQSLWLGLGAARPVGSTLSVGLSAFAGHESSAELNFIRVQAGDPVVEVFEQLSNVDTSVVNLNLIAGVYWQPDPRFGIGGRVRAAPIRLTGSGDIYVSSVAAAMDAFETTEVEIEGVEVSRPLPWDVGAGVSFRPSETLELLADLNLQLPATLTSIDDPEAGTEELEVVAAPRASLGAEWEFGDEKWLRLGLLYNKSAVPEPDDAEDPVSESYAGATGGIAWKKDRTTTSFGLFYLHGNASFYIQGADPAREGDAVARLYGAVFAVTYSL
jgi:hypothetical protein